jgi:hypothetical protein
MRLHAGKTEADGWRVVTVLTPSGSCARHHPTSSDVRE